MARWDWVIRGGTVAGGAGEVAADVAVSGGKIGEVAAAVFERGDEEIDATGLLVLPGMIDPHVHFNEPGRTDWEGFATGSAALAAGGGTCFFDMPLNSSPPVLDGESFDEKRAAGEANSITDFGIWGGITPGNLDKLAELGGRGVVGFKAFMCDSGIEDFERVDDITLEKGMEIAAGLGIPVAVHAEDQELTARLGALARANGARGVADYLASRPVEAEMLAVQKAVGLARKTGCSLHIVHVSAASVARWIEGARREADLTQETCPHYLELTEADMKSIGAGAKCAPPPRGEENRRELWSCLREGMFDFVGSDHSPAPEGMKRSGDFFEVWGGIAGVQSTLSILLKQATAVQLARLTSENVARRFGIAGKGRICAGFDADLVLVDASASYTLRREMLLDRHRLSPYVGRSMRGVVRRTIAGGQTVFCDGGIVGERRGRLICPRGGRR